MTLSSRAPGRRPMTRDAKICQLSKFLSSKARLKFDQKQFQNILQPFGVRPSSAWRKYLLPDGGRPSPPPTAELVLSLKTSTQMALASRSLATRWANKAAQDGCRCYCRTPDTAGLQGHGVRLTTFSTNPEHGATVANPFSHAICKLNGDKSGPQRRRAAILYIS